MATYKRVRRLANPFRRRRTLKRNVARRRRKMTAKQIRFFGSKRQKAALRSSRKRRSAVKGNPRRRRVTRNPAIVLTLGAVNPHKKGTAMRKRKTNKRRRRVVTAPVARRVHRRRRRVAVANPRGRRRRYTRRHTPRHVYRRRLNPFAINKGSVTMVAGGLVGVAATKIIAKFIPTSLTASLGQFGPVVTNTAAALIAGYAAQKFMPGSFGEGVMFGGLMQAGSTLINTIAPNLRIADYPIALQGMGDLVAGQFVVPQNPLRLPAAPPTQARVGVSGLARAFGTAL